MPLPPSALPTTCDIYRPFGDSSPQSTAIPCKLTTDFHGTAVRSSIDWTHYIDLDIDADIRDGCTRTAGIPAIDYADGDEVRIPTGGSTRYVVIWVEVRNRGTESEFQRAYLLRHEASWPAP